MSVLTQDAPAAFGAPSPGRKGGTWHRKRTRRSIPSPSEDRAEAAGPRSRSPGTGPDDVGRMILPSQGPQHAP